MDSSVQVTNSSSLPAGHCGHRLTVLLKIEKPREVERLGPHSIRGSSLVGVPLTATVNLPLSLMAFSSQLQSRTAATLNVD